MGRGGGYSQREIDKLLDIVRTIGTRSTTRWRDTASVYNAWARENGLLQRDNRSLRQRYTRVAGLNDRSHMSSYSLGYTSRQVLESGEGRG